MIKNFRRFTLIGVEIANVEKPAKKRQDVLQKLQWGHTGKAHQN